MIPQDQPNVTRQTENWKALDDIRKFIPQAQYNRRSFDRIFYRNLLFYVGQQWIQYQRSIQQWRPINIPDWFPKQVTNKYAVAVDAMKSVFEQSKPITIFGPGNGDEEDIVASEAAKDISDVIDTEVDNDLIRRQLASWLVLTGNGFIIDGYDNGPIGGTKSVQKYACLKCAANFMPQEMEEGCPACRSPLVARAMNQDGSPMMEEYPIGKMFSEIVSPFEMHFDMQAGSIENSSFIIRSKTYPTEVIKDMFPDKADKIKAGSSGPDTGLFYQSAIAYVTNATATNSGNYGGGAGSGDGVERTTLYHLWRRPCRELPDGGEALIADDVELWKGDMSYHDDKGKPIIPITHFGFKDVPGRIFAKTPADDLIHKQIQKNKVEALLQLGIERTTNATWLLPSGIGIENITGEPGEKIWYNGFLQGLKPERIGGSEISGSVFRWVRDIDADIEDIAATYDILKGKSPSGVPTLGGTQMLLERGLSRFADGLNSWGRGWTQVRRNRLMIWKEYAVDERTQMVLGRNSKWQAKKFSSATLSGNISVRLEEGSTQPRSKSYQQMVTGQLISAGLADLSDPSIRLKILSLFDASHLMEGLDIDIKDAIKEREEFTESGNVRFRPGIDNDVVHLQQHIKDAKSEDFFSWPPEAQSSWLNHIVNDHQSRLDEQQAKAAGDDPKIRQKTIENDALAEKKKIELDALTKKKGIDLEHSGLKKEMDLGIMAHKSNGMVSMQ